MGMQLRAPWLLAMVALAAALPSNYEPTATAFSEESSGALDRVIEEPNSEILLAPAAGAAPKDEQRAPTDQSKDDPLASTVETGKPSDFMSTFSSLATKAKNFFTGKATPEDQGDEVMPPTDDLMETDPASDSKIGYTFKKPSLPISEGFGKLEESTGAVVSKEANVPPEGATQAAAVAQGTKIAATPAPAPAGGTTSGGTKKKGGVTPLSTAATNKLAATTNAGAVKASTSGNVHSAPKKTKESSATSIQGATYLTAGLTAMAVLVSASL